ARPVGAPSSTAAHARVAKAHGIRRRRETRSLRLSRIALVSWDPRTQLSSLRARLLEAEVLHHLLQVAPRLALSRGLPQQEGGVVRRQQRHVLVRGPTAAQAGDGGVASEQRLRGVAAERDDD